MFCRFISVLYNCNVIKMLLFFCGCSAFRVHRSSCTTPLYQMTRAALLKFGTGDANGLRCFLFVTEEPIIFMSSECVMFELPSSLRVSNTRGHVNVLRALPEKTTTPCCHRISSHPATLLKPHSQFQKKLP